MRVVLCRVGEDAVITDIKKEYDTYSQIVDGYITCVYPFDDNAILVCNDEGKINGMKFNRYLKADGIPYDAIMGDFFIVGDDMIDDFTDLSLAQAEKYKKMFEHPDNRTHEHLEEPRMVFMPMTGEEFDRWLGGIR